MQYSKSDIDPPFSTNLTEILIRISHIIVTLSFPTDICAADIDKFIKKLDKFLHKMKSVRSKIGLYPDDIPLHFFPYSETIGAIKPFLNVSRFFGVPNFSIIDSIVSRGGFFTFLAFLSFFVLINQVFLLVLKISQGEDFVKKSGPEIIMRVHVILVLVWSLIYSGKLSEALRSSPSVENRINKVYSGPDTDNLSPWALRRKAVLWTVLYIILSVLLTLKGFILEWVFGSNNDFSSVWSEFGKEICSLPEGIMFHPSISSVYCLVMELTSNFLWLFGDFLLVLVGLIMAHMFQRINVHGIQRIEPGRLTAIEIDLVREHHGLTAKLVKEFDDAIASLNLIGVVMNTAFIVISVYSIVTLRRAEKMSMNAHLMRLYCKVGVAIFKLLAGLISASVLYHRAYEALSEIRSWPMAREFNDFSLNNGRASVMQAFVSQLSQGKTGLTVGKFVTITGKMLSALALGVGIFVAFARITISSCSRTRDRIL